MEDCCAVCVEPLEWVGYGPCGHRDVCSVCITRLRFVLGDKQCCICKQECPSVFVTKALGDYTKSVDSFEALAGRRDLWYEGSAQAYFDDEDQYKMIKNMCRLSCSICEAADTSGKEFVKKGYVFRNLDQLRRHLLNAHKVQMCGLCLEGRKVFICEQKLYTKKQLDRHLQNGNSDIDLNDEDRGWFKGHPLCNFCHTRFYGDNELYHHMSTDHFTCHICQRLHPGQYEYYRNYDDLEAHFRHDHALCEHPDCLSQKFIVFASDAELKRHNALVHGGNMSRAQRNAALQIPVSFQYRRPGQDNRGDRPFRRRDGHSNGQSFSKPQPSTYAVEHANDESSIQVDNTDDFPHFQNAEGPVSAPSSTSRITGTEGISSNTIEPSRYLTAVSGAGPSSLIDSAFPPLPGSENTQQRSKQQVRGSPLSMASVLGRGARRRPSSKGSQVQGETSVRGLSRKFIPHAEELSQWPQISTSQRPQSDMQVARVSSTFSRGTAEQPSDDSASSSDKTAPSFAPLSGEELRAANKALRESIHEVLQGNDDRYNEFKLISAQFKGGEMDANVYLQYVKDFGLLHIVPELARLCPDAKRREDLLNAFHRDSTNLKVNGFPELPTSGGSSQEDEVGETKKKSIHDGMSGLRLTDRGGGSSDDNVVEVLSRDGYRDLKGQRLFSSAANRSIQQNKPAKVLVKAQKPLESSSSRLLAPTSKEGTLTCSVCTLEMKEGSTHCAACGTAFASDLKPGGSEPQVNEKKKNKKTAKLHMGDHSTAFLLDSGRKTWALDAERGNGVPSASGAWGNGGGQVLVSMSQKRSDKESASSSHRA